MSNNERLHFTGKEVIVLNYMLCRALAHGEIAFNKEMQAITEKEMVALESIAQSTTKISSLEFDLDFEREELLLLTRLASRALEDKNARFKEMLGTFYKKMAEPEKEVV